ncbi:hypothetical protein FE783_20905 [Paenibacillus mesophilus]|uniref:hypothetical protein n=1 Tax=Paenibacillus mesophilus TaxID=2582849 RepID=UPI00110F2CDD|nr:hypothetical protein [Paenibacillus mesophilus]TMV47886.1 hypothetical protein FE783_20905 [Paenibacillus mesophilus]
MEWIQLEFFAGYPFGYYKLRYELDGTVKYTCDGEDIPFALPNGHFWLASKRVYQNLTKLILARPWELEIDPRIEPNHICDGWTDTLTWSIDGITEEQSFVVGQGPASLLKVMERIRRLAMDEERNLPFSFLPIPHS